MKNLFVTSFLILALLSSSFGMGPKSTETSAARKQRLQEASRKAVLEQDRQREGTDSAASSSSTVERGNVMPPGVTQRKPKTPAKKSGNIFEITSGQANDSTLVNLKSDTSSSVLRSASGELFVKEGAVVDNQDDALPLKAPLSVKNPEEQEKFKASLSAALSAALLRQEQEPKQNEGIIAPPSTHVTTPADRVFHSEDDDPNNPSGVLNSHDADQLGKVDTTTAAKLEQEQQHEENSGYLTREQFVNMLLSARTTSRERQEVERSREKEELNITKLALLVKVYYAIERLIEKYKPGALLSGVSQAPRMMTSTRAFNSQAEDTALPQKMMTPLEVDQEYYEAIIEETNRALHQLEQNPNYPLDDCLNIVCYLDSYSELLFDDSQVLTSLRPQLLKKYEGLIFSSFQSGKMGEVTAASAKQQQATHLNLDPFASWDFQKSVQENKDALLAVRAIQDGSHVNSSAERSVFPRPFPNVGSKAKQAESIGASSNNSQAEEGRSRADNSFVLIDDDERITTVDHNGRVIVPRVTLCDVLSRGSAVLLAATLAYEWYLHSLQGASSQASS